MIHDPTHAIGAAHELDAMIGRARDERFRLLHIIKEHEAKLAAIPEPVSAEHIQRLMAKVQQLDALLTERMDTLVQLDEHIDHRIDQLAQIEAAVTQLTDRLSHQLEEARGFRHLVDTAKRQVQAAAAAAKAELESATTTPAPAPPRREPRVLEATVHESPLRALAARLQQQTG